MKLIISLLAVVFALSAKAQSVSYDIVTGTCPMNDIPTMCTADMSPANPLGFYPSVTLVDDLSNNSVDDAPPGDSFRFLEFSTTLGPNNCGYAKNGTACYLGNGVVQVNQEIPYGQPGHYRSYPIFSQFCNTTGTVCITDASALTVYFEGQYVQASGYGFYTGLGTWHFSYTYACSPRYGCKWTRHITAGKVVIN